MIRRVPERNRARRDHETLRRNGVLRVTANTQSSSFGALELDGGGLVDLIGERLHALEKALPR